MSRVDLERLEKLVLAARASPRSRMNDNLHRMEDAIHRLLNAMEPESYVQPHRHHAPPKVESLVLLRGRGAVLIFDDKGRVTEKAVLSPQGPLLLFEVPGSAWHTLLALEPGTVWFEVKAGPYAPPRPNEIAAWSPAPGSREAALYLADLARRL